MPLVIICCIIFAFSIGVVVTYNLTFISNRLALTAILLIFTVMGYKWTARILSVFLIIGGIMGIFAVFKIFKLFPVYGIVQVSAAIYYVFAGFYILINSADFE